LTPCHHASDPDIVALLTAVPPPAPPPAEAQEVYVSARVAAALQLTSHAVSFIHEPGDMDSPGRRDRAVAVMHGVSGGAARCVSTLPNAAWPSGQFCAEVPAAQGQLLLMVMQRVTKNQKQGEGIVV
jgi:hypothetical protein